MSNPADLPKRRKRVLYVATVVKTHIMTFHIPFLKMLKEMGYETAVAARNDYENPEDCQIPYCDVFYDIPFDRSPFSTQNLKAYKALKSVIDSNHFDIIHCHTPVGSVLGRLCAIPARKKGTKVFYTAHGFHFYKGAPLINWLLYYPVERFLSRWTDVLITINKEDYARAQKFNAKQVCYIPGVGIDTTMFFPDPIIRAKKRQEFGILDNEILLLSVGELNHNKNHRVVIEALAQLERRDIRYIICGTGPLMESHRQLAESLGVGNQLILAGFRNDVADIYRAADIFVFPSLREGLPVAVLEAMASGLPAIVTNIRGSRDLVDTESYGAIVATNNIEAFSKAIRRVCSNTNSSNYRTVSTERATDYELRNILALMRQVYLSESALRNCQVEESEII